MNSLFSTSVRRESGRKMVEMPKPYEWYSEPTFTCVIRDGSIPKHFSFTLYLKCHESLHNPCMRSVQQEQHSSNKKEIHPISGNGELHLNLNPTIGNGRKKEEQETLSTSDNIPYYTK